MKNWSISRKLFLVLCLFSGTFALLLTATTIWDDYSRQVSAAETSIKNIQNFANMFIAREMWNVDRESIPRELDLMFQNPLIDELSLEDERGAVIYKNIRPSGDPRFGRSVILPLNAFENTLGRPVGTLRLNWSTGRIVKDVIHKMWLVFLLSLVKGIAVGGALYICVRRWVAIPLNEINKYFVKNPLGPSVPRANLGLSSEPDSQDELGILAAHIQNRESAIFALLHERMMVIKSQSEKLNEVDALLREHAAREEHSARLAQLGEMAAGIAHEINNPLTIIAGFSYSLRLAVENESISQGEISRKLSVIEKTCQRITKIIAGLRVYARDGGYDPFEDCLVKDLIEDVTGMCAGKMLAHKIDFKINLNNLDNLSLQCRPVQLAQVFIALLNNSFDAVYPLNRKWIAIEGRDLGERIEFSVTDSGAGIPDVISRSMFQPFFTTKPVGKGTGLGLSVAHGIITGHGGEIRLDRDSVNTRFVFTIPKEPLDDRSPVDPSHTAGRSELLEGARGTLNLARGTHH